jgi:DNA-binding transcriptional LysR family regulator
MTLEQLRIFLAVAQHLSFTRAADSLFITQSAVSASIRNLESECNVQLFDRVGRSINLTGAGELLNVEAQNVIKQVELIREKLRDLNGLQRGELRIGASFTVGNYILSDVICAFRQAYPGIQVRCVVGTSCEIVAGIGTRRFDLGVITGEVESLGFNHLNWSTIGRDRLIIVVGKRHPWFNTASISKAELVKAKWIMREVGSGMRQTFEKVLRSWGIAPEDLNVVLELNSSEMIKASIAEGIGVAVVSELMILEELKQGIFRPVQIKDINPGETDPTQIERSFFLVRHKERIPSEASKVFEQMVSEFVTEARKLTTKTNSISPWIGVKVAEP